MSAKNQFSSGVSSSASVDRRKEDTPGKKKTPPCQSHKIYLQEIHNAPSNGLSPLQILVGPDNRCSRLEVMRKIAASNGLEILTPSLNTAISDHRDPFIEIRYYGDDPVPEKDELVRLWDAHLRWILNIPTKSEALQQAQRMYPQPPFAIQPVPQMMPQAFPFTFGYVRPTNLPNPFCVSAPPTGFLQPLSGYNAAGPGIYNHGIYGGAVAGAHHNYLGTPERPHQDRLQQMKIPSAPQIQNEGFEQTGRNQACAKEEFKYQLPKQSRLLPLMNQPLRKQTPFEH